MRIALIVPGFSAAADDWAIPALLNLARHLATEHEVHVFSQRYPPPGTYRFAGLTHHALGGGQRFGLGSARIWLRSTQAIVGQHRLTPFDVLHAFWADEAGLSAAIAGAIIGRPVVVSLGGGELTRLPDIDYGAQRFFIRRLTTGLALKRATIVTAGSRYQLDLCRSHGVEDARLRLAPLGVDTSLFKGKDGRMEGWKNGSANAAIRRVNLIQVASLLPVKNQRLLLEVLGLVKANIPDIGLEMVGTGPLEAELKALADRLGLREQITWRGQVPYPALPERYQQARLYVQTSRHESQGMAVLEAMACGIPVIGSPVGVVPEVGCRPATDSVDTLAAQVCEVLTKAESWAEESAQARQTIRERFSLEITTKTFVDLYHEAMSSRNP